MSDFLKKFLLEDSRRFSPSGRFVALGAFGKHPGWDDHVEDLGLETEGLNLAKTTLYVNGIGGQIDSGAWEKLDAPQQLPGFKHLFIWQRSGQILLGRLWSSSDGKGRKRYPMVVCLHFMGVTLSWALKQGLPVLAELEQGCIGTNSAGDVRALLARKRAALRDALQSTDGKGEYAALTPESLNRIITPPGNPEPDRFLRVLYQLQSQFGGFSPGSLNSTAARVQQIRVPAATDSPEQALLFWTRFFLVYVDASVPLLLTLPLEANWVDVTAGEPESHEMFCLRATPKAVPLVSEVPYNLDQDFRAKAATFLEGFRRGETTKPNLQPATPPVSVQRAPKRTSWLKWLGVGSIVVLGSVAALFLLKKGASQLPAPNPPPASRDGSQIVKTTPGLDAVTPSPDTSHAAAATQQARLNAQAEAARQDEVKKTSDAVAAAARLKAETEAAAQDRERQLTEAATREKQRLIDEAAAKEKARQIADAAAKEKERQAAVAAAAEKERQAAEVARLESERQAALRMQLQEQQVKPAESAAPPVPSTDQSQPKVQLASSAASVGSTPNSAPVSAATSGSAASQLTNGIGMVLVLLPSGVWVGKYEVTQAQYKRVMNTNPSHTNWLSDLQPVQQVTWNDAVEFTRKLTSMEQASLPAGMVYSLPTEKQWSDFAAGQKIEELPGGTLLRKAGPLPVGQAGPPNKFGLFDVLGNVWEWCLDDAPSDQKLLKGGAFSGNYYDRTLPPDTKSVSCGFRCILTPSERH